MPAASFRPTNNQRYVQNDPGFTLGGPGPVSPLQWAKRNVLFRRLQRNAVDYPSDSLQLTPTAAERAGNFSQAKTSGGNVMIYDPLTTTVGPNGSIIRQPFAGNVIPASRIDPVAANIVSYYPSPNGSFQGGAYNYDVNASNYQQIFQGLIRVDHNFGDNDKFFARYGRYNPNNHRGDRD